MKIVIVQNTLSAYNVPLFAEIARNEGFELTIICQFSELNKTRYTESKDSSGFKLVVNSEGWLRRFIRNRTGIALPSAKLHRQIADLGPDAIAIDGLSSVGAALTLFCSRMWKKRPIIWWSLGATPERLPNWKSKIGDMVQRFCATRSAAVFAYGTHSREYFLGLGIDAGKIVVGHNTIDEKSVLKDVSNIDCNKLDRLKSDLSITNNPVAVYCGRLMKGKKVDLLLHSFASLTSVGEGSDFRLVLIGDGPERLELEKLANELGLNGKVSFVGEQHQNLSMYFMLGDFCVLPGLGGLAINHAFAHALPVVCGPADGTEVDLVRNGETGILLNELTVDTLSDSLGHLFGDSILCKSMGKAANKLITSDYSLSNYNKRFAATVERVVGELSK